MTQTQQTQHTQPTHPETGSGFSIEAKISLTVIALGVLAVVLKAFGLF